MSTSKVQWSRVVDDRGRLFTVAHDDTKARGYLPGEGSALRSPKAPQPTAVFASVHSGVRCSVRDAGNVERLLAELAIKTALVPSNREQGVYFPRIYLGPESPDVATTGMTEKWLSSVRSARLIFGRLRDLYLAVEPDGANADAYGHGFRQLLILACTEVEAAWRSVLEANAFPPPKNDRYNTCHYVKLRDVMTLEDYQVKLSAHPSFGPFAPFRGWDPMIPTDSLAWYAAYNATKHDREAKLSSATLAHATSAAAALYIMIHAQFGPVDRLQDPHFHEDAFTMVGEPRAIADWYIRPNIPFDAPPVDGQPKPQWQKGAYPWGR